MNNRQNPYNRLLGKAKDFAFRVKYPRCKTMWVYPRARIDEAWRLGDLYERTKAADQLGYDVKIVAGDNGLEVQYVKRPDIPCGWTP